MKIREVLSEAKGTFGRKSGDIYKDETGKEYSFVKLETFPTQGKFESLEEFQNAVEQVTQEYKDLIWVDKSPRSFGSFAVVTLSAQNGELKHFAKIFSEISGNMFNKWSNSGLPGLTYQGKGSKKSEAGFKPQQLFPQSASSFNSGKELVQSLISSPSLNNHIKEGIQQLSSGQLPIFKDEKENFEAIRDFLGETLQVIAITNSPQLVTGQLEVARSKIMGSIQWKDCSIEFPRNQNYGLVDSLITAPSGEQIGISSKGGSGANASIKNIYDSLTKLSKELKAELNLTPGSVSIYGMINAVNSKNSKSITLILDQVVWNSDSVGFHPNINTSTLELTHENLEKFYNTLKCKKEIMKLE
jgi:hypothetical protein